MSRAELAAVLSLVLEPYWPDEQGKLSAVAYHLAGEVLEQFKDATCAENGCSMKVGLGRSTCMDHGLRPLLVGDAHDH